jgi:hypothetical protein
MNVVYWTEGEACVDVDRAQPGAGTGRSGQAPDRTVEHMSAAAIMLSA